MRVRWRNPGTNVGLAPDCAIGRRCAPTRWLHPGYDFRMFLRRKPHSFSANAVGVFPVTCRNACEKAGTLA